MLTPVPDQTNLVLSPEDATSLPGPERQPKVAPLPDGGFVAVWLDWLDETLGAPGFTDAAMIRVFNADGSARGPAIPVSADLSAAMDDVAVIALTDGKVGVAWRRLDAEGAVRAAVFDPATGTFAGPEQTVAASLDPGAPVTLDLVGLVAEPAGRFGVVVETSHGDTTRDIARTVIRADGGAPVVTALISYAEGQPYLHPGASGGDIVSLGSGQLALVLRVARVAPDSGYESAGVFLRAADGTLTDTGLPVDAEAPPPVLLALADGGIAMAQVVGPYADPVVRVARLAGGAVTQTDVAFPSLGVRDIALAQLPDASLVVVGLPRLAGTFDAVSDRVLAMRIRQDMTQDPAFVRLDSATEPASDAAPAVAVTGDGRLVVAWQAGGFEGEIRATRLTLAGGLLVPISLAGGPGNDSFKGFDANDTLAGGDGADTLSGGNGADLLDGQGGDDRIQGGNGVDTLRGGTGQDWLFGGAGDDLVEGEDGADTLRGGDGNDTLAGGEGNDYLLGEAGDNAMDGGTGADTLQGGNGADTLSGGDEADRLNGGGGNDLLDGGLDADTLHGWDGADTVLGGDGDDWLQGGAGRDLMEGGEGNDLLNGGADADTLRGGNGTDGLSGADGNDLLEGDAGADTLRGGGGADTLRGGTDGDVLDGGDGANLLQGEDGRDTLSGGTGNDTLEGGADDDRLLGTSGFDSLSGGDGNDSLDGGDQDDRLDGGAGADTMWGGYGRDTMSGGGDNDAMWGGYGADSMLGEDGADRLWGGEDNDTLLGGNGADALRGGYGTDSLAGGAQGDVLDGEAAADTLLGEDGADLLRGGLGDDRLDGGEGTDTVLGGNGVDTLRGGLGADLLNGGPDADLFVFGDAADSPAGLSDTLQGFERGLDRLDLSEVFAGTLTWRGTAAFTGAAGEVRQVVDAAQGHVRVEVALDAGTQPDMTIIVTGTTPLQPGDVIL